MRLRDWITQPKSTGYEALHTTVMGPKGRWVEVQIRSKEMNEIAEKGYAAHYKYKHGKEKETGLENWLNKLKDALENTEANAVDFVENVKLNLYSKEIYTFTPNGDIKSLPKGATPIDFAYAIHTDVGSKCRGAKVNGKIVPLSRELQSGDQIDIITSNNQKPKLAWLDYAVTSRARSKIKNALKEEQKLLGEEGKDVLRRKLRSLKVKYNEKTINNLVAFFKLKTSLDLFYRIGNGSISNTDLKKFSSQQGNALYSFFKNKTKRKKYDPSISEANAITQKFDLLVFGKDEETLPYINAKCCNPIPGDKVFGFVTINEGIKLHRVDCPNAVSMQANYGYRTLKAKWIDSTQREFKVNIMVSGIDNVGIVNDVTLVISNAMNVNIQRINIESEDGYFEGHIRVSVKNIEQLNTLISNLKSIEGVMKVEREKEKKK
jgi:GTP pyrophosphokinase